MSCLFWIIIYYFYLLFYLNTAIQSLNHIFTTSHTGNHEYNTRSKDATNADQTDLLPALSKVESNLMQNITNLTLSRRRPSCSANQWTGFYMVTASVLKGLKDKVINLKDIIIKNLQDENKRLKPKVNVLEKKLLIWKSKTII